MPHWNDKGEEEWVCQKGGHICTGSSKWVERGSELAWYLKCTGNVCVDCLVKAGVYITKCPNPRISAACSSAQNNITLHYQLPHCEGCTCYSKKLERSDW